MASEIVHPAATRIGDRTAERETDDERGKRLDDLVFWAEMNAKEEEES